MQVRKIRNARDLLVQTRVVFHRARAQRIHALIDGIVTGGNARKVPHHVDLSYFGHSFQIVFALKLRRNNFVEGGLIHIERRQTVARAAPLRALEDQLLVGTDVRCDFGNIRIH